MRFFIPVFILVYSYGGVAQFGQFPGNPYYPFWGVRVIRTLQKSQKLYGLRKILSPKNPIQQYSEMKNYERGLTDYLKENTLLTKEKIDDASFYMNEKIYDYSPTGRQRGDKFSIVEKGLFCPNHLGIIQLNRKNFYPRKENTLSFANSKYDFDKYMKYELGFCWGHAYVTKALRTLAFFDSNHDEVKDGVKGSLQWKRLIQEKIKNLVRNLEPQYFPFLANLRELSEFFEEELKNEVIWAWGENAPSFYNLYKTHQNEKTYTKKELEDFIFAFKTRLVMGEIPLLNFNLWGKEKWSHVVLAYGFEKKGDDFIIYLDDNKFVLEESEPNQRSRVVINLKTQEVEYSLGEVLAGEKRVGQLRMPMEDILFYGKIVKNLILFCNDSL